MPHQAASSIPWPSRHRKSYTRPLLLTLVCTLAESVGELLLPVFPALLADTVLFPHPHAVPDRWLPLIRRFGDDGTLVAAGLFAFVLTAMLSLVARLGSLSVTGTVAARFGAELREDLAVFLRSAPRSVGKDRTATSQADEWDAAITRLERSVALLGRIIPHAVFLLIGSLILSLSLHGRLSVILALTVPLLIGLTVSACFFRPSVRRNGKKREAAFYTRILENLRGMGEIRSFVLEKREGAQLSETDAALLRERRHQSRLHFLLPPLLIGLMQAGLFLFLWFNGRTLLPDHPVPVGSLLILLVSLLYMALSVFRLTTALPSVLSASDDLADLRAFLLSSPVLTGGDHPTASVKHGKIEFRHVSFRLFADSPERVLNDVSFTIPAGSTVGLIGSAGSGKTSLVSLISRLYDAGEGTVLIDDMDVRDFPLSALRDGIVTSWTSDGSVPAPAVKTAPKIRIYDAVSRLPDLSGTDGMTRILSTRRVAVVRDLPVILVLDDGHIVGVGTHEELLASNVVYRELCASQLSDRVRPDLSASLHRPEEGSHTVPNDPPARPDDQIETARPSPASGDTPILSGKEGSV